MKETTTKDMELTKDKINKVIHEEIMGSNKREEMIKAAEDLLRMEAINSTQWRGLSERVADFTLAQTAELKKRLAEAEARFRLQNHLYFNAENTGRRLFWTEVGWELEGHRSDEHEYVFDTVEQAFAAVDEQGEPRRVSK